MLSFSHALLERFETQAPSYQSYPSVEQFQHAFGPRHYAQALEHRHQSVLTRIKPLAIYVHLPFCANLCYFCNRHKIVTKRYSKTLSYLELIEQELKLQVEHLGHTPKVSQLHLSGGTPTYLHACELANLISILKSYTHFAPDIEMSMDIDPRSVNPESLGALREMGFWRLNYAVQDCTPRVQRAVHRVLDFESLFTQFQASRAMGFRNFSLEILYGLPKQTLKSFEATLAQVLELSPERVTLTHYKHQPDLYSPQRKINPKNLPSNQSITACNLLAQSALSKAGYEYIGLDVFSKKSDPLYLAKRQGRLYRNFLGFCDQPNTDLMALGMSGIGAMGSTYSQNATTLEEYSLFLKRKQLPVVKGLKLSRDDLLRKSVIMGLMCQGHLSYEDIEMAYFIDFSAYFAQELQQLKRLQERGLVQLTPKSMDVTELGSVLVRTIASVFDRYWTPSMPSHF